mmetsp:Transcript_39389/g.105664  ORF Transcript_39389/g.105664 Transcript_39389/m.105664 type:complete len:589 (+) Transcript_39389:449-2215(+)
MLHANASARIESSRHKGPGNSETRILRNRSRRRNRMRQGKERAGGPADAASGLSRKTAGGSAKGGRGGKGAKGMHLCTHATPDRGSPRRRGLLHEGVPWSRPSTVEAHLLETAVGGRAEGGALPLRHGALRPGKGLPHVDEHVDRGRELVGAHARLLHVADEQVRLDGAVGDHGHHLGRGDHELALVDAAHAHALRREVAPARLHAVGAARGLEAGRARRQAPHAPLLRVLRVRVARGRVRAEGGAACRDVDLRKPGRSDRGVRHQHRRRLRPLLGNPAGAREGRGVLGRLVQRGAVHAEERVVDEEAPGLPRLAPLQNRLFLRADLHVSRLPAVLTRLHVQSVQRTHACTLHGQGEVWARSHTLVVVRRRPLRKAEENKARRPLALCRILRVALPAAGHALATEALAHATLPAARRQAVSAVAAALREAHRHLVPLVALVANTRAGPLAVLGPLVADLRVQDPALVLEHVMGEVTDHAVHSAHHECIRVVVRPLLRDEIIDRRFQGAPDNFHGLDRVARGELVPTLADSGQQVLECGEVLRFLGEDLGAAAQPCRENGLDGADQLIRIPALAEVHDVFSDVGSALER